MYSQNMAVEIERKFLVISDSWKSLVEKRDRLLQGYFCFEKTRAVRVRMASGKAWLTVKTP